MPYLCTFILEYCLRWSNHLFPVLRLIMFALLVLPTLALGQVQANNPITTGTSNNILDEQILSALDSEKNAAITAPDTDNCQRKDRNFSFEPSATNVSFTNGYWLSEIYYFSQFLSNQEIKDKLAGYGFQQSMIIEERKSALRAIIAHHKNFTVVAFRGTVTTTGVAVDSYFKQVDGDRFGVPGRIHSGFAFALNSGWDRILPELRAAAQAERTIWFVGHSLGGSLAVLAAARAHFVGLPVAGVYTLANPKIGDRYFSQTYSESLGDRTFRFVNQLDMTPHVPPAETARGEFVAILPDFLRSTAHAILNKVDYFQLGQLYRFGEYGEMHPVPDYNELSDREYWQRINREVWVPNMKQSLSFLVSIGKMHNPEHYICGMARQLDLEQK